MLGLSFRLCPAISGWGSWCARLGLGSAVTPPLLAGVWGVGAWLRVLVALRFSWLLLVVCVCGFGVSCTPPFLVWVLGCVVSCVRPVPFPPPSAEAACGVGLRGSCRCGVLSPPFLFSSG